MRETSKSKKIWHKDGIEYKVLQGKGIDIGPADDLVVPHAKAFDLEQGDANKISHYVKEEHDFVYASHCLEHMHDPWDAVQEWWKIVKVGGYLFFAIPDEDLYEQGVFPSRFNPDHKATFTISKTKSWSPKSVNVLDLANSLKGGEIISLQLQDHGYDRTLTTFGPRKGGKILQKIGQLYFRAKFKWHLPKNPLDSLMLRYHAIDQTRGVVLSQIRCIIKKVS